MTAVDCFALPRDLKECRTSHPDSFSLHANFPPSSHGRNSREDAIRARRLSKASVSSGLPASLLKIVHRASAGSHAGESGRSTQSKLSMPSLPSISRNARGGSSDMGSWRSSTSVRCRTRELLEMRRSRYPVMHDVWHLLEHPESSRQARIYGEATSVTIVGSVALTLLQDAEPSIQGVITWVCETFFDGVFTLDIVLRFIVTPNRWGFMFKAYNIIDLLAGPPFLALRLFSGPQADSVPRAILLYVVPVLRLLKLVRRFEKFHLLLSAFRMAVEALPVLLYTLAIQVLIFSALIFYVEPRENIASLPDAMWLTIVSLTTVGFGDSFPQSSAGRIIVSALVICGILYMAIPIGIVGNAFSKVWEDRDRLLLVQRTRDRMVQGGYTARDIPALFNLFDSGRRGYLTLSDFRDMIYEMRLGIDDERTVQLFKSLDRDGDAGISDKEFLLMLFPHEHEEIYSESEIEFQAASVETTLGLSPRGVLSTTPDNSSCLIQESLSSIEEELNGKT